MRLETFRAIEPGRALAAIRAQLGEDAVIVRTNRLTDAPGFEVVATTLREVEAFRARLERPPAASGATDRAARRQRVVALVGPAGAGKTTTIARLALSARGFAGSRVGVVSLDTYRIGAAEQIQTYADAAGLPLEILYDATECAPALHRLRRCDVVLVDTPGRGPRAAAEDRAWRDALAALGPDEVHLVLPAGLRTDVARATVATYREAGVTHLLLTRLDEVPGDDGVAELAAAIDLPSRWACDGQEVPASLHAAPRRLCAALCGGATLPGRAA